MFTLFFCCGVKTVLFTNKLSEYHESLLFTKVHASQHFGESYTKMHIHIVVCCGVKMVLFTNKLSECWCRIINPYLLTKFHTSKYLGKRVTQTCMFTLFFVVVRKGYCLPTVIRMLVLYQYSLPVYQVSCIQVFW